jgi:hypothetical protein
VACQFSLPIGVSIFQRRLLYDSGRLQGEMGRLLSRSHASSLGESVNYYCRAVRRWSSQALDGNAHFGSGAEQLCSREQHDTTEYRQSNPIQSIGRHWHLHHARPHVRGALSYRQPALMWGMMLGYSTRHATTKISKRTGALPISASIRNAPHTRSTVMAHTHSFRTSKHVRHVG